MNYMRVYFNDVEMTHILSFSSNQKEIIMRTNMLCKMFPFTVSETVRVRCESYLDRGLAVEGDCRITEVTSSGLSLSRIRVSNKV